MGKIFILFIFVTSLALGYDITFPDKEVIISKGEQSLAFLDTDECVSPLYFDWDSDGVKDLLTGYWDGAEGYLRFYKNYGGDDFPEFRNWEHVQAAGGDISAKGG